MDESCKTKYPVFILHGCGFRDHLFKTESKNGGKEFLNYWGRIPKILRSHGARLYFGGQDSWATVDYNAGIIIDEIEKILDQTGCRKINLLGHSKGGLEARLVAHRLGAEKVASVTTVATPHHGSYTMDKLIKLPKWLFRFISVFVNLWCRILGDSNPDFYNASLQFSTELSERFNKQILDTEGIYYQSYACKMKNSRSDMLMWLPHFIINKVEGESDGLITVESAKWGDFKGIIKSASNRGISHLDEIDLRRKRLTKRTSESEVSDITEFYINIFRNLKENGF